MIHCKIKG